MKKTILKFRKTCHSLFKTKNDIVIYSSHIDLHIGFVQLEKKSTSKTIFIVEEYK